MYFTKVYNFSLIWTCEGVGLYGRSSKILSMCYWPILTRKYFSVMKVALVCSALLSIGTSKTSRVVIKSFIAIHSRFPRLTGADQPG